MRIPICLMGLTALAAYMQCAHADELDEVIVTATRSARALADIPASASVVTATEVQDTPAQSLDDVLRHVPGVNLPIQSGIEAHPTADNVSMRGLGGIHALVLLDGVPLNDPFFGYVQWGRIPMEAVDHIEVVRGGGSPFGATSQWVVSSTSSPARRTRTPRSQTLPGADLERIAQASSDLMDSVPEIA